LLAGVGDDPKGTFGVLQVDFRILPGNGSYSVSGRGSTRDEAALFLLLRLFFTRLLHLLISSLFGFLLCVFPEDGGLFFDYAIVELSFAHGDDER
jgi:hypothetical protein